MPIHCRVKRNLLAAKIQLIGKFQISSKKTYGLKYQYSIIKVLT